MESYEHLREIVTGKLLFNEPMKYHTSLQTGGPADVLLLPKDTNDVSCVIEYANKRNIFRALPLFYKSYLWSQLDSIFRMDFFLSHFY